MDNYFNTDNNFDECPAKMEDGRLATDYRSAQVREKYFEYKNCLGSENEARTFRINNAEQIMDNEWNYFVENKTCNPRQNVAHQKQDFILNKREFLLSYPEMFPSPSFSFPDSAAAKKSFFHTAPKSYTSNSYNKAEMLAYNRQIPPPLYTPPCYDNRLTITKGSLVGRNACQKAEQVDCGYGNRCPQFCCGNSAPLPDNVRDTSE